MQRYWSTDPRFSAENFGFQPVWLILQAIEQGAKLAHEKLHMQELGIAELTAVLVNVNRSKGEPVKGSDFHFFKPESEQVGIRADAAEAFFVLASSQQLPPWAVAIAPIDQLKSARSGQKVSAAAWTGEDIVLIQPRIQGNRVTCPLAIIQGSEKETSIDCGETIRRLRLDGAGDRWVLDAEFWLIA